MQILTLRNHFFMQQFFWFLSHWALSTYFSHGIKDPENFQSKPFSCFLHSHCSWSHWMGCIRIHSDWARMHLHLKLLFWNVSVLDYAQYYWSQFRFTLFWEILSKFDVQISSKCQQRRSRTYSTSAKQLKESAVDDTTKNLVLRLLAWIVASLFLIRKLLRNYLDGKIFRLQYFRDRFQIRSD